MSEDDDNGAQKLVVMIGSLLAFATLCVIFSCYRICMEDHKRKNQQQLAPSETEPTEPSGFNYDVLNVRQTPQTTCSTATQQSDHQLIFGATSLNISTITTDVLNTSSDQEMRRQRPISDLQSELERRAQERRENLERNEHEFLSVPPYTSQDETLPSYDQVVRTQVNN